MNITETTPPSALLTELARRLTDQRLACGLTQEEAARMAGVAKRTIERVENGCDTQLTTLFRILRILGLAGQMDVLVPEHAPSPMEELKKSQGRKKRRRVRHGTSHRPTPSKAPWKWGDEQ